MPGTVQVRTAELGLQGISGKPRTSVIRSIAYSDVLAFGSSGLFPYLVWKLMEVF